MQIESDLWAQGRIARITTAPWEGRLLFLILDTAPGWWIGVLSPPAIPDTPRDFYADEPDLPARLEAEGGLEWYARGPEEEALEAAEFGWRPFPDDGWVNAKDTDQTEAAAGSPRTTTVLYLTVATITGALHLFGLPRCSWSADFLDAMVRPATVITWILALSICIGLPLLLVRVIARRLRTHEKLTGHVLTFGCALGAASLPMGAVSFAVSDWSAGCAMDPLSPLLILTQLFGALSIFAAAVVAVARRR